MPAGVQVVKGRAVNESVKFAETYDTDLIVIATHGLTGIEHLLLGSTTEKLYVSHHVRCSP